MGLLDSVSLRTWMSVEVRLPTFGSPRPHESGTYTGRCVVVVVVCANFISFKGCFGALLLLMKWLLKMVVVITGFFFFNLLMVQVLHQVFAFISSLPSTPIPRIPCLLIIREWLFRILEVSI